MIDNLVVSIINSVCYFCAPGYPELHNTEMPLETLGKLSEFLLNQGWQNGKVLYLSVSDGALIYLYTRKNLDVY